MPDRGIVAALLACALITACVSRGGELSRTPPVAAAIPSIQTPVQEEETLFSLSSYQALASAPVEEQRKEWLAAQEAFSREANETSRLRLLLALSLPAVPWRDENRVLGLLEASPGLAKGQDALVQQLNFLLYRLARERQRMHEEQRRREADLHEEQRRRETELHEEQRRNAELLMKLDALRRIDQDLRNRKRPQENTP